MQKRFRKVDGRHIAEVWLDIGLFRYKAELYEDGELTGRQRGPKPRPDGGEVHLIGRGCSALLRALPDGEIRCTWSR